MSTQDDLVELLRGSGFDESDPVHDIADIVITAGWRPPARVVTTPDELDSLPVGSVVRSNWTGNDTIGFVCVRYSDGWRECIHQGPIFPLGAGGTATVLHEGGTQ